MQMGDALQRLLRAAHSGPFGRRAATRAGSPRILVVGVCQGAAVARAMRYLLPEAEVTTISAFHLRRRFRRLADLVAEAGRHDVVFANTYLPAFPDGGAGEFHAAAAVKLLPTVVFSAFHPDQVRVGDLADPNLKGLLTGPMGHSHSALALFGYLEGLSVDATERLFRGEVYAGLGYLDGWDGSVLGQRTLGQEVGWDLDAEIRRWALRGCFMHCDNHPKMHVLSDLARLALRRAGIPFTDCDLDSYLPDDQGEIGCWPVYPEIAEYYGVPGSALFLSPRSRRLGPARTMTRRRFLDGAFAGYRSTPSSQLVCERVAGWRADPETRGYLRQAAGLGR